MRLTGFFSLVLLSTTACGGGSSTQDTDAMVPDSSAPTLDAAADASSSNLTQHPKAIFVAPRSGASNSYYDLPWPSDVRVNEDGTLNLEGLFVGNDGAISSNYAKAIDGHIKGWGTQTSAYFRFTEEVGVASLPNAQASMQNDASVQFIDVTEGADEVGTRIPFEWHWQNNQSFYYPSKVLAVRPVLGWVLEPNHTYAVIVTNNVRNNIGARMERDADFEQLVAGASDTAVQAVANKYQDAIATLTAEGVDMSTVVSMTVFTTQDPVGELFKIRDWVMENVQAPTIIEAPHQTDEKSRYYIYEGRYGASPILQTGTIPYNNEGGKIDLDVDGNPHVVSTFNPRFALSIPKDITPGQPVPIALCAHGTGGDYRSCMTGEEADAFAEAGWALFSTDQIHHGERNPGGGDPSLLFFNIGNPDAARDNTRQSAIDVVQQARAVAALTVDGGDGPDITFDASRIGFFGHSQGALNGALLLAIDNQIKIAGLSGPGAVVSVNFFDKTEPVNIPSVVQLALGLLGGTPQEAFAREGFTLEHPLCSLIQTFLEVSDPANYGKYAFYAPRSGFAPKSVIVSMGVTDEYAPPAGAGALITAMRAPIAAPIVTPVQGLALRGITAATRPVQGNVGGGQATAGVVQANGGHFIFYEMVPVRSSFRAFFATSLTETLPELQ